MRRWMSDNSQLVAAMVLLVLAVGGLTTFLHYSQKAHREREVNRIKMMGLARDIILDTMRNEQECKEKLKEAEANRHPFHEFWDAPYEGGD